MALAFLSVTTTLDAFRIKCFYRTQTGNSPIFDSTFYYCDVKFFILNAPNQTITSVDGDHYPGYNSNSQVDHVQFEVVAIDFIPLGIASEFLNLQSLTIAGCELKAIEKFHIQELTKLRLLYLANNNLETLKSDLFESNVQLQYVYLHRNKLKSVGLDILKPLMKLIYACFYANPCINKAATTKVQIVDLQTELNLKCQSKKDLDKAGHE